MGVAVFIVAVAAYLALVNLTPVRIGGRVGFWVSAVGAVYWSFEAASSAFGHRWLSLTWELLWAVVCAVGAWCWSDDLRRDRAKSTEVRS